jgi:hypothetical protein
MKVFCVNCNKAVELDITQEQLIELVSSGNLPVEAFPHLTPAELEMLNTGLCDDCWNAIASPPDSGELEDFGGVEEIDALFDEDYKATGDMVHRMKTAEEVEDSLTDEERKEINDAIQKDWEERKEDHDISHADDVPYE